MPNAVPAAPVVAQPHVEALVDQRERRRQMWVVDQPSSSIGLHAVLQEDRRGLSTVLPNSTGDSVERQNVAVVCGHVVLFQDEPLVLDELPDGLEGDASLVEDGEAGARVLQEEGLR